MEVFDTEAESALLGALIINNDFIFSVSIDLHEDHFFMDEHKKVYSIMKRLFEEKNYFDILTIADNLKSLDPFFNNIYDFLDELKESAPNIYKDGAVKDFIVKTSKIIVDKYKIRQIAKISDSVRYIIDDAPEISPEELEESVVKSISGVNLSCTNSKSMLLSDIAKDVIKDLEERSSSDDPITGARTGFKELDSITRGFQNSDLIIIGARPSMGKSALAINLMMGVYNNWEKQEENKKKIVFFSLEMSSKQVLKRILSAKARIPLDCFYTGQMESEEWDRLANTMSIIDSGILIDDTPKITTSHIRKKLREIKKEIGGVDMVVVDYLQIMKGESKFSRENEISSISSGLKEIAKDFSIPVIALCQVSRDLEKRPVYDDKMSRPGRIPVMSDLRESGAIEQDADIVSFLYRDEVYNKETQEPGIARLSIAKHRNGKLGEIKLKWHSDYQLFANI